MAVALQLGEMAVAKAMHLGEAAVALPVCLWEAAVAICHIAQRGEVAVAIAVWLGKASVKLVSSICYHSTECHAIAMATAALIRWACGCSTRQIQQHLSSNSGRGKHTGTLFPVTHAYCSDF